jgi:hypothetical protein
MQSLRILAARVVQRQALQIPVHISCEASGCDNRIGVPHVEDGLYCRNIYSRCVMCHRCVHYRDVYVLNSFASHICVCLLCVSRTRLLRDNLMHESVGIWTVTHSFMHHDLQEYTYYHEDSYMIHSADDSDHSRKVIYRACVMGEPDTVDLHLLVRRNDGGWYVKILPDSDIISERNKVAIMRRILYVPSIEFALYGCRCWTTFDYVKNVKICPDCDTANTFVKRGCEVTDVSQESEWYGNCRYPSFELEHAPWTCEFQVPL